MNILREHLGVNDGTGQVLFQTAYHGTSHKFKDFSLEHIGTGEGAQAHGWGLYFAQDRKVSEDYPNNGRAVGSISPEIARTLRLDKPGAIVLDDIGLQHIEDRHGKEIRGLGFADARAFVDAVLADVNAVYAVNDVAGNMIWFRVPCCRKDGSWCDLNLHAPVIFIRWLQLALLKWHSTKRKKRFGKARLTFNPGLRIPWRTLRA